MPIFFPGLWGEISSRRSDGNREVTFTAKRVLSPIVLKTVVMTLPAHLGAVSVQASATGHPAATASLRGSSVALDQPITLAAAGDGFTLTACRPT